MNRIVTLTFLLAGVLTPCLGWADAEAEAKVTYAKARAHFKAGRYAEAAADLNSAYALKPHPALLRYLGDTYYKMNNARAAIAQYKRYLREAPQAADKDRVEARVRQLEMIVGDDDKGATPPLPVPAPAPAGAPPPAAGLGPDQALPEKFDAPTGEDKEVPTALARKPMEPMPGAAPGRPDKQRRNMALAAMKWTTAGLAVAGLAMGITFNRLAASKASDLENAARTDCPVDPKDPSKMSECGGNPDLSSPKVAYGKAHYDLQQSFKLNNAVSIATFVVGGVMAATSIVLFVVDAQSKPAARRPGPAERVVVAPVVGSGMYGLAGGVTF